MGARDRYQQSAKERNATDVRRRRAQLDLQDWTAARVFSRVIEAGPRSELITAIIEVVEEDDVAPPWLKRRFV